MVECWGCGNNANHQAQFSGTGGGAGAYARKRVTVIPGNNYPVAWGAGSSSVQTDFGAGPLVRGASPNAGVTAVSGKAVDSIGDVKWDGGNGKAAINDASAPPTGPAGGGGGSSAGRNAPGIDGVTLNGGAAVDIGGAGGMGGAGSPDNGSFPGPGTDAGTPGGGGGGAGWSWGNTPGIHDGVGGGGAIVIWDMTATNGSDGAFTGGGPGSGVSQNPALIVGSFGSPPPAPPALPKGLAFIM